MNADLATNTLGWQWVAGVGAYAAPYFRIFNRGLQAARFNPDWSYVQRWPGEGPVERSRPTVDHREANRLALRALATVKMGARRRPDARS